MSPGHRPRTMKKAHEEMQNRNTRRGKILCRDDKSFTKFEQLLARAENEGRIDGDFKCLVCGMCYLHQDEVEKCCMITNDGGIALESFKCPRCDTEHFRQEDANECCIDEEEEADI